MRVGVIGYGHWGKVLIRNFDKVIKEFDTGSMIYVHDPFVSVQDRIAFSDLDIFLNNVDIVVIATPAEVLYPYSKHILESDKHVFCEKPILHPCYLDKLYSLASTNNLTFFVNNLYLFNENVRLFSELIGDSVITHIDIDWYNGYLTRENVNVFTDLSWHALNIIYSFLPYNRYDTDDFVIANKKNEFMTIYTNIGDVSISCKFSWLDREKIRRINIRTEDGTNFIFNESERFIKKIEANNEISIGDFVEDNSVENSIRYFFNCIESGLSLPGIGVTRWSSQFVEDVNRKIERGKNENTFCGSCSSICSNKE
jgi:predicted dehydrogenase